MLHYGAHKRNQGLKFFNTLMIASRRSASNREQALAEPCLRGSACSAQ